MMKYTPIVAASANGNECSLLLDIKKKRSDYKNERSEVDNYVHHFLGKSR